MIFDKSKGSTAGQMAYGCRTPRPSVFINTFYIYETRAHDNTTRNILQMCIYFLCSTLSFSRRPLITSYFYNCTPIVYNLTPIRTKYYCKSSGRPIITMQVCTLYIIYKTRNCNQVKCTCKIFRRGFLLNTSGMSE